MSNASNDIFVSDPFQLALPQGTTTVSLTSDYEVVYKVNSTTGADNILIYPNPASTSVRIENAADSELTIINEDGKTVKTLDKISNDHTISVPDLENGVYFIRISKGNSSVTRKLVILKN